MRTASMFITAAALAAFAIVSPLATTVASPQDDGEIRLVVRADDMGAAHGVNAGCAETLASGIARSVEVIVPGPWFVEAARLLRETPGEWDVGVHLDLTSEWELVKWGPVASGVPSIVDAQGKFFPMTRQRRDFPPNTGFLECGWKVEEVERELRAQIELALEHLPRVTHLSAHMGTATASDELRALVRRLAEEYRLPMSLPGARPVRGWSGAGVSAEEKETRLANALEELSPGLWMIVEHPALDTPEMRAIGHEGYRNVAEDRAGVTRAFTSDKVKEVIRRRGIKLVSYADVLGIETAKTTLSDEQEKRMAGTIEKVDRMCRDETVHMVGPAKAERLAQLVRRERPKLVVECGTALGYSGLWIARELARAGSGRLITIELDGATAARARTHFEEAGVGGIVEVRVGDAREVVKSIEGPVDLLFIDCNFGNYHGCFTGIEGALAERALVVADNVGIGAAGMASYLELVRTKHESTTEWFDIDLPWAKRDAMEITRLHAKRE